MKYHLSINGAAVGSYDTRKDAERVAVREVRRAFTEARAPLVAGSALVFGRGDVRVSIEVQADA